MAMMDEQSRVQRLREGWLWCLQQRESSVFHRARLNYETRYCVWRNQSVDGRKWKADLGKEIFPWEGASDARVPLIDKYVREDAAFLMTVWRRMRITARPVESNDSALGNRLTSLLRWQLYTQMKEAVTEHRLFASWGLERGAAVMGVLWRRERQMAYEEVDLETIQALAVDPQWAARFPVVTRLPELILNPGTEDEAASIFAVKFAEASQPSLRRLVRDLRTSGHGRLAVPAVVADRPKVVALCLNEEVFLPPEAIDVESAGEVYWRELVTETQLRERVGTLGWDDAWVDRMITTQKGKVTSDLGLGTMLSRARTTGGLPGLGSGNGLLTTSRLFEIIHGYVRRADENGVPEIRYTAFNAALLAAADERGRRRRGGEDLTGLVAKDEPLGYAHGRLPFVLWEREKRSRLVDDARGYGEVAATMQRQIKVEWDSRADRASVATLPPMFHPPGKEPERWGPGTRVPQMRAGEYGFIEPPAFDPGSQEVENTARRFADEYFGRTVDQANVQEAGALKQDLADTWMEACGEVGTMVLQLDQQYMPDQFYFRVVGSAQGKGIHATREEIQGSFDVTVAFNAESLNPELNLGKLKLMEQALAMDVNGITDRDEALAVAFEMIDPNLGERLLKPGENATQHEIEDEQGVFAKMFAGVPVDVKPGQAYGTRLKVLQEILQKSPPAQARYKTDPNFRALVDWRMQQLGHQLEQRDNAQIGRLGGKAGFEQFPENAAGAGGGAMGGVSGMGGV